jgi:hypothetical protein
VNILSVRCLLFENFTVDFFIDHFTVCKDANVVAKGNYINNLPVFFIEGTKDRAFISGGEDIHRSLGHVSYSRIRKRLGIPVVHAPCESCAVSKITKA